MIAEDANTSNFLKTLALSLALLVALAGVAGLRPTLSKAAAYRPAFVMNDEVREEVNSSAFATILGEMRASMADLMWVKTERYLHRGVAYKPHLDAEAMAHNGEVVRQPEHEQAGEEHEEHHHPQLEALVPDAAQDYRGFVGTLQRAVQPWKGPDAPDEHTAGDELVPWYRMLTLSDPHHWRGYMIGSWWLSKIKGDLKALGEASAFIAEGIKNNPEVFQLYLMDGRLKIQQEHWREAITAFEQAAQRALKVRPAGGKNQPPIWTDSDEEDFAAALRYVPSIKWRKLNDPQGARVALARGLALLPQDKPLLDLKALLDAKSK